MKRVSSRQLALLLGISPERTRGVAIGLRIEAEEQPSGHFYTDAQARRIREAIEWSRDRQSAAAS